MGGTKGYRSYRGRTSKGKIALAVLLVLIILAAVGFLWLQEYIVYDRDGSFHLELPWKTETPPAEEEVPPEDVEITIQEPEKPKALAAFSASAAPLTQAGWKDAWLGASVMSAPAYNAAAVTLKDSSGHIYFAATGAAAGTVSTAEDTAAALAEVTESSYHSIGRMSCFLDPIAARADVEGMGLKNTGGYIFYDGNNGNWLDPSKPAARQYLCTLAAELAQQGVDEILLTDVGYPTVGKLDKIDYNGADRRPASGCSWRSCAALWVSMVWLSPLSCRRRSSPPAPTTLPAWYSRISPRWWTESTPSPRLTRSPRWKRRSVPPVRTRTSWRS